MISTYKKVTAFILFLVAILAALMIYRVAMADPTANHLTIESQACTRIGFRFTYTDTGITPITTGSVDDIGQVLVSCPFSPWSYDANEVTVIWWRTPGVGSPGEVFYSFRIPGAGFDMKYLGCTVYAGIRFLPYGSTTPETQFLDEPQKYNCPNIKIPFIIKDTRGLLSEPQVQTYPEPEMKVLDTKQKKVKNTPYP